MTTTDGAYLAVVPAYNEAEHRRRSRALAARARAAVRRARGRRRLDGRHARASRARAGRDGAAPCRSTSASAAPCRRASSTRSRTATTTCVQVDGDGQHDRSQIQRLLERHARGPDARHGVRLALPVAGRDGYPAPVSRAHRASTSSRSCCRASSGQRVTDPTSGFRLYNRRAIELFARDYPHDYPEVEAVLMLHSHRLRMREVPVRCCQRGGGVSSITLRQVRLLHGQGAARDLRRPRAPPPGRRAGRPGARGGRRTGSDGDCGSRSSRSLASGAAAARRARARAPAPAARALRAAVAVQRAGAARPRDLDAACSRTIAARSASPTRRTRCSSSPSASCSCCCCTSRSRCRG